ncbi:MAG: hypothetical protein JSW46_04775 [Gemmatimonadota bacterium]|nr:MAG: hypothetical protein JSW46_04775 [Gemmatimonadota bacterium]
MVKSKIDLPIPELEPRPISLDEYRKFTPEKLELLRGYLIAPADEPEERRRLLVLLLVNLGLVEAVKLVPEASWHEALGLAYGAGG